jgi:hypothetical protein
MANDCDNDSIVIEDSIRKTCFKFMNGLSREQVFKGILDCWALRVSLEPTDPKLQRMKRYLVDTFFCWIKLRLPDELFVGLVHDCPNLLRLTF